MTTARTLLEAAFHDTEPISCSHMGTWRQCEDDASAIADTPSGAELLRRADEPRGHGLDDITDAQLDPHSRQYLRRADEPRVADVQHDDLMAVLDEWNVHGAGDFMRLLRHSRIDSRIDALALPAPRPPEPDRTAALVEALEFAADELLGLARSGWSYPAEQQAIASARFLQDVLDGRRKTTHEWVSGGGLSSWMGDPGDAPCMRCGKHRTASRHIILAATPEPAPVTDGTEP